MARHDKEIRSRYLIYLMSLILPPSEVGSDSPALILFESLDEIPFEVFNELDYNRVADAMDLRIQWCGEDPELTEEMAIQPVSLLEILVELSRYMAFARENLIRYSDPERWFFEILGNIGVDERTPKGEVIRRGTRAVRHEYSRNGTNGGFFPLKNCSEDVRTMELWMQMNRYLVERYHA